MRGIAVGCPGEFVVATTNGQIARWWPARKESVVLAEGFDRLYGVAVAPGGIVIFSEAGRGRVLSMKSGSIEVLATNLREPMGVAVTADGTSLVAEEGAGRVIETVRGRAETLLDGLDKPQGLFVRGDLLYVVDAGAKELIEYDLGRKARRTVASNLPIGAPAGVIPKFLKAIPPLSGPMVPFAGITGDGRGTLYISADAEGSVLALNRP